MAVQVYFGEAFRLRLLSLSERYKDKLDFDFSGPNKDGSLKYFLLWKNLTDDELSEVKRECEELPQLSANPCKLEMFEDYFEFAVKSEKMAYGFKMVDDWLESLKNKSN